MKMYGITSCNTVKKAIQWLRNNDLDFEFHDYKKMGVSREKLEDWSKKVGWEKLLNKKGTTWKKLTADQQEKVIDEKAAIELMVEKPSIIRRPIIEGGKKLIVGFDEEDYKKTTAE